MSFKISLKPLTIFAKTPILYAWLDSWRVTLFLGGNSLGPGVHGEHFLGGKGDCFLGGNFPGGQFPEAEAISRGSFSGGTFPGAFFPESYINVF